jgi:predicted TIM-barrel fold metal-dependent hydrolase
MRSRVLVLGRHEGLMAKVERLLGAQGFEVVPALRDEDALRLLSAGAVQALIIGGGVEADARPPLLALAARLGIPVVQHTGGPVGLVDALSRALASAKQGDGGDA